MIPIVPDKEIRAWLKSLLGNGKNGINIDNIAAYMGIPKTSLTYIANSVHAGIGFHRQMHLSKVMAMIENGQLDFKKDPKDRRKKIAVIVENPKPIVRYQPVFTHNGPKLKTVYRPKAVQSMPTFKAVIGNK